MAVKLIDTLENYGLVSGQAVERLTSDLPFKQIVKIRHDLQESLCSDTEVRRADEDDSLSPFNFIASASFRGDTGCGSWYCHTQKAEILARYAACFCDRVVVPIDFGGHHEGSSQKRERYELARGLLGVVEMRPVIDAGVVVPVASMFHYCPNCFPEKVPQVERIIQIRKHLIEALSDKFWMTYEQGRNRTPGRVRVHGPESYIEHGEVSFEPRLPMAWLPKSHRTAKSIRLTDAQMKESKQVDRIIGKIAMDVSAQQVYSTQFNAAYLTNISGEAQFLKLLQEDDHLAARTATVCAQLTHSIPLFTELPLDRVMKVRKEDREAFDSYRVTLSKIVKENIKTDKQLTQGQAQELYNDVLQPEVANLKQQAKNERKTALKESALSAGVTAGVIALGAYSGFLPTQLTALCTAVGGIKLVTDLAKSVAAIQKNPSKVRNSNLYFLLRLRQEAE